MTYGFPTVANTYSRFPVMITKGKGTKVWDDKGREYLDFTSGIAVTNLGHAHPELVSVAKEALERFWHCSNLFWNAPQVGLSKKLVEKSFGDAVFFCNSGAESVEAALKLMRRYGHETKGPHAYEVIALEGSFHGRTLGALSLTGQMKYQKDFRPLVPIVTFVPRNDIKALELAVSRRTCGIIVEPIQGEGGVFELDQQYLEAVREIAHFHKCCLCFDEVQSGMGRTGRIFAYEETGVEPDIMCLAKALSNGLPIGAMVARKEFMAFLPPGTHASTFGGGPVVTSVAEKVLDILCEPGFLDAVQKKGEYLRAGLEALRQRFPEIVGEIRGRGLMLAAAFTRPIPGIVEAFRDENILVLCPGESLLRILPPLIVEMHELDAFLSAFSRILESKSNG